MRWSVHRAVLTALLLQLLSADGGRPPPPCQSSAHRQFDFWVGTWKVTAPDGANAGTNRIERTLNDCVLVEHWDGSKGGHGTSFNTYDATRKVWHQTWVDDSGGLLVLEGRFENGKMVLQSALLDGKMDRITWEPLKDGSVRQLWESTTDGGKTWKVAFDGHYVKA